MVQRSILSGCFRSPGASLVTLAHCATASIHGTRGRVSSIRGLTRIKKVSPNFELKKKIPNQGHLRLEKHWVPQNPKKTCHTRLEPGEIF